MQILGCPFPLQRSGENCYRGMIDWKGNLDIEHELSSMADRVRINVRRLCQGAAMYLNNTWTSPASFTSKDWGSMNIIVWNIVMGSWMAACTAHMIFTQNLWRIKNHLYDSFWWAYHHRELISHCLMKSDFIRCNIYISLDQVRLKERVYDSGY